MRHNFVLLFILLTSLSSWGAEKLIRCSVSVNGQAAFQVDSIYPQEKAYLEARGLASGMGWRVVDRNNARAVYFDGKPVSDVKSYNGKTYVSAEAVASAFGYQARVREEGLVVDFWSRPSGAGVTAAAVDVSIVKREKMTSPIPDYETLRLTLSIKNRSSQPLRLQASKFYISDNRGERHLCQGNFEIGVPAGTSQTADRLYFNFPQNVTPKKLHIVSPGGEELGSARL